MSKIMFKVFLVSIFILGLTASVYAQPVNDLCTNAIAVNVPSVTPGTNINATADADAPACETQTQPGVWYTVVGTGGRMTATTCADFGGSANYDSKISVFSGDCGSLNCIAGNDDACTGLVSLVSWNSQSGTVYRILVHGFGGATGNFDLAILSEGQCVGQSCYVPCSVGSCSESFCSIYVPGMQTCFDIGQIEYCGCTPPSCPQSECVIYTPVAP